MSDQPVKGQKRLTTANTLTNAVTFTVEQIMRETLQTAEVVRIDGADQPGTEGPAGYAAATPLVCHMDGYGRTVAAASVPKMPFFRPQAGKAAIVMDPQPGDKAVLVAMKRDSSGVTQDTTDPAAPASFRSFDQADGYLINGFLGQAPEIWLHLNPASGDISLSTKAADIEISCRESGDIDIVTRSGTVRVRAQGDVIQEASGTARTTAPRIVLDGDVRVTGNLSVDGVCQGTGGPVAMRGGIDNQGGVIRSNAVTLETHTHTGVQTGGGSTGAPDGAA